MNKDKNEYYMGNSCADKLGHGAYVSPGVSSDTFKHGNWDKDGKFTAGD